MLLHAYGSRVRVHESPYWIQIDMPNSGRGSKGDTMSGWVLDVKGWMFYRRMRVRYGVYRVKSRHSRNGREESTLVIE